MGLGFAVETTRKVAAECGAPALDDAESLDSLEDVLEAHLRPYGDDGAPEGSEGGRLP